MCVCVIISLNLFFFLIYLFVLGLSCGLWDLGPSPEMELRLPALELGVLAIFWFLISYLIPTHPSQRTTFPWLSLSVPLTTSLSQSSGSAGILGISQASR